MDTHTSRSALFPSSEILYNLSPLILRLLFLICVGPLRLLAPSGRSILCRIDTVTLRVFHNMDTSLSTVLATPVELTNAMARFQTAAVPHASRPKGYLTVGHFHDTSLVL